MILSPQTAPALPQPVPQADPAQPAAMMGRAPLGPWQGDAADGRITLDFLSFFVESEPATAAIQHAERAPDGAAEGAIPMAPDQSVTPHGTDSPDLATPLPFWAVPAVPALPPQPVPAVDGAQPAKQGAASGAQQAEFAENAENAMHLSASLPERPRLVMSNAPADPMAAAPKDPQSALLSRDASPPVADPPATPRSAAMPTVAHPTGGHPAGANTIPPATTRVDGSSSRMPMPSPAPPSPAPIAGRVAPTFPPDPRTPVSGENGSATAVDAAAPSRVAPATNPEPGVHGPLPEMRADPAAGAVQPFPADSPQPEVVSPAVRDIGTLSTALPGSPNPADLPRLTDPAAMASAPPDLQTQAAAPSPLAQGTTAPVSPNPPQEASLPADPTAAPPDHSPRVAPLAPPLAAAAPRAAPTQSQILHKDQVFSTLPHMPWTAPPAAFPADLAPVPGLITAPSPVQAPQPLADPGTAPPDHPPNITRPAPPLAGTAPMPAQIGHGDPTGFAAMATAPTHPAPDAGQQAAAPHPPAMAPPALAPPLDQPPPSTNASRPMHGDGHARPVIPGVEPPPAVLSHKTGPGLGPSVATRSPLAVAPDGTGPLPAHFIPHLAATPLADTVPPRVAVPPPLPVPTAVPDLVVRQVLPNLGTSGPVTVTLAPADLGTLRFEVTTRGEGIHLHLMVEAPATLDLLRRQGDQILAELRQAGFVQTSLSFAAGGGQMGGESGGAGAQGGAARDGGSSPPQPPRHHADPPPPADRPAPGLGSLDMRL